MTREGNVSSSNSRQGRELCGRGKSSCGGGSGQCFLTEFWCDGKRDCSNGGDEESCADNEVNIDDYHQSEQGKKINIPPVESWVKFTLDDTFILLNPLGISFVSRKRDHAFYR